MNYLVQLEQAVNFIENNLTRDIKVEEIACNAGYSYFHFHRIFEAVSGETVGQYLRSRRLARAASDLLSTNKRIIDIALEYRFESQEAFSRAFKRVYKTSPGSYRRNRIGSVIYTKKPLTVNNLIHLGNGITIEPRIIIIEDRLIVGIRGKTTLRNNRIPDLWGELNPRIEEIPGRTNDIRGYGICEVDPDFDMATFNEDTEYSEFVGVEVSQVSTLPEKMTTKVLKGGRYAVFTHLGDLSTLNMTYDYIWGTWVPYSGYEVDLRDDFEFYDERFIGPTVSQSEVDIYIPVK